MALYEVYEYVVVGGGIIGLGAAYQLSLMGKRALLIEQYPLPHNRGSSSGPSRVTRKAYKEKFIGEMMNECYEWWEKIEKETNTKLYQKTGMLCVGDHAMSVNDTRDTLKSLGMPYEYYASATEICRKFPTISLPSNYTGVYDPDAGTLRGDKCVVCLQSLFLKYGGAIHDSERVENIAWQSDDVVTVATTKSKYKARGVIICVGPWSPKFLKQCGIPNVTKATRVNVSYWKEKIPGTYSYTKFPVYCDFKLPDSNSYFCSLPVDEYLGYMKFIKHAGAPVDPDERDKNVAEQTEQEMREMRQYIRQYFPGIESDAPCFMETCMYTQTPDEVKILDTHPLHKNIVYGAGFSGQGFKLAPVVGKLLAELVTGKKTSYDLKPFRAARFTNKSRL